VVRDLQVQMDPAFARMTDWVQRLRRTSQREGTRRSADDIPTSARLGRLSHGIRIDAHMYSCEQISLVQSVS